MKSYMAFILSMPFYCMAQGNIKTDTLPAPSKSTGNYSKVIGWKNGRTPKAPPGFTVTKYADGFENPRWMYVTPNGDVLVAQSNSNYSFLKRIGASIIGAGKSKNLKHSADVITLLRDTDKDGVVDLRETFLKEGLSQPFGMLVIGNWFYVANTDAVLRYPYVPGQTKITGKGEKIVDLPAGKHNRHWTRNIIANADNSKIYIAVGSGSNIAEEGITNEILRACILEVNPDGSELRVYASGLRNPVGMGWAPDTKTLWTVVNERDGLGENLVPDYLTSVKENGFYGWPYVYFGQNEDIRVKEKKPELVKKTIVPDMAMGPHTASLGLAFYTGNSFPEKYRNGAFIAQHGSWNRKILSGYKVVFVPFKDGKPSGKYEDFLTGFIVDPNKDKVYGRPVGVVFMLDGSLLLTDDKTNTVWRVSASK
ncbi:sorbosone dehydrogenase family protein [Flavobacterium sp.]|uniref:PQQ-dependent sugar dehydrogenase n=1 Tax=Flavobacterium sp. TaxID=239 RepID=UPI002B4B1C0F|nr:sorbosone dehydrogenase family protein [Flavobacterium sp.]HLF52543.1 sorbosone dehydrogenase family protein [Flavobacterium sp.]